MTRPRRGERGAALLLVMVAVAVLTALAVDLAYDTRVGLRLAANARDELRAGAAAKGGIALSRLVLSLQQQIDAIGRQQTGGRAVPGQPAQPAPSFPRPQLWRIIPVGQALADGLFGGAGAPAEGDAGAAPVAGGFEVAIDDEARKVNAHLDASAELLGADVRALYQLVCDPRWDALFDREDANGLRASRQDLLVHLHDWVDQDEQSSGLAAAFPQGSCAVLLRTAQDPFEPGFGDENFPYDRGEDRYRAKNARMDSLAELTLVAGVTDAFMAAFGDALTVYLKRDEKRNVNEPDPARRLQNAMAIAASPDDAVLRDPEFSTRLDQALAVRTFGGMPVSLSPADFREAAAEAGLEVRPLAEVEKIFTDRSSTFRLRAVGRAGDVAKTLDVVVRFDPVPGGAPVVAPGRVLHWREE